MVGLGGFGDGRYGDVVPALWSLVKEVVLDPSQSGLSPVNDQFIAPITESLSGTAGDFAVADKFISERIASFLIDAESELRITDVHLGNLDSVGAPLSLLELRKRERKWPKRLE